MKATRRALLAALQLAAVLIALLLLRSAGFPPKKGRTMKEQSRVMKVRPGLDDIMFQIADQVEECELLQRVVGQLATVRASTARTQGEMQDFFDRHLLPQLVHERERLAAMVVERGEHLARIQEGRVPEVKPFLVEDTKPSDAATSA